MTVFLDIYHPDLPATATSPVRVSEQSLDEHYAKGWLLVDPDAVPPPPDTAYYTTAASDSRFAKVADVGTPGTLTGDALRAASGTYTGARTWTGDHAFQGDVDLSTATVAGLSAADVDAVPEGDLRAFGVHMPHNYGGVAGGAIDCSNAFRAMVNAAKAALRTVVPSGLQGEKSGTISCYLPPGDWLITDPGAFLGDEAMTENGVGLRWTGAGKSISTVIFQPATAGALISNDYWMSLQFENMGFLAATPDCTFMQSWTTHAAQDYNFRDVRWWNFRYGFDLQGSNNNSEYRFTGCDTSGFEADGAFLYIGMSNTVDQFLNFWFDGIKHWSTAAPLIDAAKGGHFHLRNVDASNWGSGLAAPGYLFYLRGGPHADGVCQFEATGVRVEGNSALAGLIHSEWNQGNVVFRSVDWSPLAGSYTYGDIVSIVYTGADGPHYVFEDSTLAGGVKVKTSTNDWVFDHAVTLSRCTWLQKASPSDVVTYDTTGNTVPLALPPVEFVRCRGQVHGNSMFDAAGTAVWDATIGYRGELLQSLTPRVVSVRSTEGIVQGNGTNLEYVILPVGALITGFEVLAPSGTSAEADGGTWTLKTTEGSPTTIATATVAGAMSAGFDVKVDLAVPFLCDTSGRAKVSITPTNVTTPNPGGLILIKGYW